MPPLESAARPPPAALNPHRVSQGPPWAGALALPVPRLCGLGGALGSGRWSGAWPLPRLLLSCPASSLCIDPFHRFWQDGQAQWCSGLGGCGLFSQVKASLGPDRLPPSAHGPKGQKWDVFTLRSGNCLITTVETAPGTLSCHPGLATVWMRGAVGSRHQPQGALGPAPATRGLTPKPVDPQGTTAREPGIWLHPPGCGNEPQRSLDSDPIHIWADMSHRAITACLRG